MAFLTLSPDPSASTFEKAAHALMEQCLDARSVGEVLREKVTLNASDPRTLLETWLNTLLHLLRSERLAFSRTQITVGPAVPGWALEATLWGEPVDVRAEFKREITGQRISVSDGETWQLDWRGE